ncbi:MAG: SprT family zinc-dependent metalloprotease [Deltaproteobacteria bacterium]|nr:MAG: SprT family zinc-dependent metalloprotease [Deltaproteobacteria bacterium]
MIISIYDDYIRSVFEKFMARMKPEVIDSFEGFLETVKLVEIISKSNAAGVCRYETSVSIEEYARIEISRTICSSLSEKAIIGVFAHEFGHLEDRLFNGLCSEIYNEDAEITANTIACYWGFKDEILIMHEELDFQEYEIPIDLSELDADLAKSYWETRHGKVSSFSRQGS